MKWLIKIGNWIQKIIHKFFGFPKLEEFYPKKETEFGNPGIVEFVETDICDNHHFVKTKIAGVGESDEKDVAPMVFKVCTECGYIKNTNYKLNEDAIKQLKGNLTRKEEFNSYRDFAEDLLNKKFEKFIEDEDTVDITDAYLKKVFLYGVQCAAEITSLISSMQGKD